MNMILQDIQSVKTTFFNGEMLNIMTMLWTIETVLYEFLYIWLIVCYHFILIIHYIYDIIVFLCICWLLKIFFVPLSWFRQKAIFQLPMKHPFLSTVNLNENWKLKTFSTQVSVSVSLFHLIYLLFQLMCDCESVNVHFLKRLHVDFVCIYVVAHFA